ncbi:glycosyltransferase [Synechococcus sp. PCC 7336]|uniref:glycosyltransferase n=1 Tax=Synechococcus sp. PCC 7336 TaxID=195250 RepID=UPI0003490974|nr:glycosyltransferase [Synechococcus sp. PCC 7336]
MVLTEPIPNFDSMSAIALGSIFLSLAIWLGLLTLRGRFWTADQILNDDLPAPERWPSVCAVIPARNEAEAIATTVRALLAQEYAGELKIVLVDDQSTDGTADVARQAAEEFRQESGDRQLEVLSGKELPAGWTGKLWALEQGTQYALKTLPDYILLTDADIQHNRSNLRRVASLAERDRLDMASVMVRLRCKTAWERFLIPAFIFFFMKLYPFRWVNDPDNPTAGAAGGCILIRSDALQRIGGMACLKEALIDDCTLAAKVKANPSPEAPDGKSRIWLGLGSDIISLRPYPDLDTVWKMVSRTAFTQLNYSTLLLIGTLFAMALIYLVAPLGLVWSLATSHWIGAIAAAFTWCLMALSYWPTLKFYRQSPLLAFALPAIAFLYTLMTLDSAIQHWQGKGGAWKGRVYPSPNS